MDAPGFVDIAVAVTGAEAVVLLAWHRWGRRGPAPRQWIFNLGSGLCLMLALRGVLQPGAGLGWLAWLAGAGVAHAADLLVRLRVRPS